MSTQSTALSNQRGPAGRTVGRAIARLCAHAAATVVLTAIGLFAALEPVGPGTRDRLVFGRSSSGLMEVGGISDNQIGTIDATTKFWRIRGAGGQVGLLAQGATVRSGPGSTNVAELLAAAERLASYLEETRSLQARVWCRQGPFLLFETKEGGLFVLAATLATAAAAWIVLFTFGRALITGRARRARAAAGQCISCGYARSGLAGRPCPECGSVRNL